MSVKQAASVLAKASWQRNGKRKAMVLQKKKNETNADKTFCHNFERFDRVTAVLVFW